MVTADASHAPELLVNEPDINPLLTAVEVLSGDGNHFLKSDLYSFTISTGAPVSIEYVSNHTVQPGQVFSPTITVRVNSGELDPARGDQLRNTDGNTFGAGPVQPIHNQVPAGSTYTFDVDNDPSFAMTAPTGEGSYNNTWRVWADGGYASNDAVIYITVDGTVPSSAVDPLGSAQTSTPFTITWSGSDNLSGIASYDVQYRDGAGGTWTDWVTGTSLTSASFTGQNGHTYCFRSRARDRAGNVEGYPVGNGDICVTVKTGRPGHKVYLPLVLRNYTPVRADFTAWPTSGPAPLTVVFTNTSTGYDTSLWSFGDGSTSTGISPTHVYTTGVYTVTLTVSKVSGTLILPGDTSTLTRTNYITVAPSEAPSHLQATPISPSQIRLDWQDNSSDEAGFEIYCGESSTITVPPNTTSYTLGGLAPASYHCCCVRAFNDHGNSAWSEWACIHTFPSGPCAEGIANGGFENDGDWVIPDTEYPAAYTTVVTRSGNRSMRVGIVEPADNRMSYSSARQTVTIPTDTVSVTLRFWLYPVSGEPSADLALPAHPLAATIQEAALASDRQYVIVLDEYGQWINTLVWQRTNDQQWTFHEFDLKQYAGRTIKLQFGAYNDGWSGVTGMYVDDVSLEICSSTTCARLGQD